MKQAASAEKLCSSRCYEQLVNPALAYDDYHYSYAVGKERKGRRGRRRAQDSMSAVKEV